MQTINKHLYDALIEAGASEAKATAAASHDIVSELGAIRTELKWIKAVGAGLVAAVAGLYWQMFTMNANVAEILARLS